MRIAVFSDSINIPPKEGINVHTYDLLIALAKHPDCTPVLVVCDRGWLSHDVLKEQLFDTILLPEREFYNVEYVSEFLARHRFDIAQSYMTYFGAVVLGPAAYAANIPCVAELHDLEESVVSVYFTAAELPQATRDHTAFQKQAAKYASLVRVMSRDDYTSVRETWPDYDERRYMWMPVSRPATNIIGHNKPDSIGYIGNMSYAPNAEGAQIIRDTIAPLCNYKITFIGRGSEDYGSPSINALGMVDDIEPILANMAIGLAPILQGSGMKIKNLTYLSHGIPLITTALGARGFPESEAIIIEDNFARWPSIIHRLMTNGEERRRLSKIASRLFAEHFDIENTVHRLIAQYQVAVDRYPKRKAKLLNPSAAQYTEIDLRHVYWLRELRETGEGATKEELLIEGREH